MNTQKIMSRASKAKMALLLTLFCACSMQAQIDLNEESGSDVDSVMISNNKKLYKINYTGRYFEATIPSDITYDYLYLRAVGGDGGYKKASMSWNGKKWAGGKGALVEAAFEIGDEEGQIPPGSTIRFMVGEHGSNISDALSSGAAGGGGTGIAFKNPDDNWHLLMVAAAGSGASGDCCTSGSKGDPGASYKPGKEGNGGIADFGVGVSNKSSMGAGAFKGPSNNVEPGWPSGPEDGEPTGGNSYDTNLGAKRGGWGFGAGGCGVEGLLTRGAGGGYTGGDMAQVGDDDKATSFINTDLMEVEQWFSIEQGTDNSPENGYAYFQLVNELKDTPLPVTYSFSLAKDQNKCLDSGGENYKKEDVAWLWPCKETNTNQQWIFDKDHIKLKKSPNKCLNLSGNSTKNGNDISYHDCNGTSAQEWIFDGLTHSIRLKKNLNKCIDVQNGKTVQETPLIINDCSYYKRQQWGISNTEAPGTGKEDFNIYLDKDREWCFDSGGTSESVWLWDCGAKNTNQRWTYSNFQIKLAKNNKCLDIKSEKINNGQNIQVYDCKDKDDHDIWNQQWIYDGIHKQFRNKKHLDKCIDLEGGITDNRTNIRLWDCKDYNRQKWIVESSPELDPCAKDNTPPVARCKDVSFHSTLVALTPSLVDDHSSDACNDISLSLNKASISGSAGDVKTVTLTVTDTKGNSASCEARITLLGN